MSKPPFVHLHTHSHYSLLDGLSKVPEMVKLAEQYHMPALALTDHGNLYGAIEFYKECKKRNIKPIIGVEAYVAERTRFDKEPGIDARRYHLTLLAKNLRGYRNLIELVTRANLEGYYYKPRVDRELLAEHREGIICLSGCFGAELSQALHRDGYQKGLEIAAAYKKIYGDDYYIEIMRKPEVEGHSKVEELLVALSRELDIPLVATQDSHYLHKEDRNAHDVFLNIQTSNDNGDQLTFDCDASFIDTEEAYELFKEIPEAVENTSKIADQCGIELELGSWVFPNIETRDGRSYDEELREKVLEGLPARELSYEGAVKERIDYELRVIRNKGYSPYFLVVADIMRFAHENNIFTSIRGSVAGSITTYLLGITDIDPIEYKLPFERFLNPERPSAPDIDMDFADNRRDEVIEYVREKYGDEKVAQIGTFGTMMARGAVRDIARALGHPYAVGDKISRLIPLGSQGFPMTIDYALESTPELKELYNTDKTTKEIIDLAKRIEGSVRHISVHAAGVVIAPEKLTNYVPLQHDPRGGKIITQYDMHAVEDAGLLKFDLLGIRNLSILADAIKRVKKIHGVDIKIDEIPLDDKKTFELLSRGETMGLFQLNGAGVTRYLKELKPTSIHDINAMVALYRPGPMEVIPEYIRRKHNPELISYPDPRMEKYLKESYGLIVYQDDLLFSAIELAGYSWLEADKFRKAVGKKIPSEMAAQKEKLIKGIVEHGQTQEFAERLWDLFEPFQAYGFNKAHAASYGRFAYHTAYMKANYPTEYMAAVLSAESGDVEEVARIIEECKRMGIEVLPPDVNESFKDFSVVREKDKKDKIRFGLYAIKNLGSDIGEAIIKERKENGPYESLDDFLCRVDHRNLNKKSLEALIQSGAMDGFGERGKLLANMDIMLQYHRENAGGRQQTSLFGDNQQYRTLQLADAPEASKDERLAWEKELLGLYISGHPLEKWKDKLKDKPSIEYVKSTMRDGMVAVVAGMIEQKRPVTTKAGEPMAFLRIADFTDGIDVVVFPSIFLSNKQILELNKAIAIKGRISERGGEKSLIVEAIKELR